MDGKNYIKMYCDPYERTIQFEIKDEEEDCYKEPTEYSPLASEKFTSNVTLDDVASDLFKEIQNIYNSYNDGVEIAFHGIKEDYQYLVNFLKNNNHSNNITVKQEYQLKSPYEAIEIIDSEFEKLENFLKNNALNSDINLNVEKYKRAMEREIPIVVVGLFSSGKSALINALIGAEILNSKDKPTTSKIIEIRALKSGESICIIFETINNTIVEILIQDRNYEIKSENNSSIIEDLDKFMENLEFNDTFDNETYIVFEILNFLNEKDDILNVIQVKVPFIGKLNSNKFDFIIYDTPGSDNAEKNKHDLELLKSKLNSQVNGLPLFISELDDLSRSNTDDLVNLINVVNDIDLKNAMLILNKSDKSIKKYYKMHKELVDGGCYDLVNKLQPNKILFTSSIVGIEGKKKYDNWIIEEYSEESIDKNRFINKDQSDGYSELYKCNIYSEDRSKFNIECCKNFSEDKDLYYANSGILAVENEIMNYAETQYVFNKYNNAKKYITKAIEILEFENVKIKDELDISREETNKFRTGKVCNIGKELDGANIYISRFNSDIVESINKESKNQEENLKILINKVKSEWKSYKKSEKKFEIIIRYINREFSKFTFDTKDSFDVLINKKTLQYEQNIKESYVKIISDSPYLDENQKNIIKDIILKFNVSRNNTHNFNIEEWSIKENGRFKKNKTKKAVNEVHIFFKKVKIFDIGAVEKILNERTHDLCHGFSHYLQANAEKQIKNFITKLKKTMMNKIDSFNSETLELSKKIEELTKKVEYISGELEYLNNMRDIIDACYEGDWCDVDVQ